MVSHGEASVFRSATPLHLHKCVARFVSDTLGVSCFLWERMLPGRKDSFIHGNAGSESEFGQNNGPSRNIWARTYCKIERRPQIFTGGLGIITVPTTLKLHFNPCPYNILTICPHPRVRHEITRTAPQIGYNKLCGRPPQYAPPPAS